MKRALTMMAIVFTLAGCGGGGGGGGAPNTIVQPTDVLSSFTRDNPTAEDIMDHWDHPEVITAALGLSPVSGDRKAALLANLEAIGGIDPSVVEIIGERNGITYGIGRGGPAGTLDIEFDWRFAEGIPEEIRVMTERAGKSWSYRLADDYPTYTIPEGTRVSLNAVEPRQLLLDEAMTTDGIVIFMDYWDGDRATGSPKLSDSSARQTGDYQPYVGAIVLDERRFSRRDPNNARQFSILTHEIGHAIGISRVLRRYDFYNAMIDEDQATFNGPNAVAEYGGPVPFQWRPPDGARIPLDPFAPGAVVDWSHIGPPESVMSYGRDTRTRFTPSELDFAWLDDIGYDVLDGQVMEVPELYVYGAWGTYSGWSATVERTLTHSPDGNGRTNTRDILRATVDAFGRAPLTAPTESFEGNVTWSGSLLGVDIGRPMLPPVTGTATLTINMATLTGSARFGELQAHVDGATEAFRASSLQYGINVVGNTFSDNAERIEGGFYGPSHEEMAGLLNDRREDVGLLAGFGGRR